MTSVRPIRSYVLRQGRVSQAQQRAYDHLLPVYGITYADAPLDFAQVFGRKAPTVLEIGFGMGETTAAIAAQNPDCNYIAVDVHTPGIGGLLKLIGEQHLTNVRVIQHDAVEVVDCMIPRESLARVHVFFPDPWHKKRHHKRRLLQAGFVEKLAARLAPGGYLHIATDWEDYAAAILATLRAEPLLENTAQAFAARPDYRPLTKFEQRGLDRGHGVWDLIFKRKAP